MNISRTPDELARHIAALTNDLSPDAGQQAELERAQRLIARALIRQPAGKADATAGSPSLDVERIAVDEWLRARDEDRIARVVRRDIPSSPTDASETLGPFFTAEGRRIWFDVFEALRTTPTFVQAASGPFVAFTNALVSSDGSAFTIAPGGVWIRANAVDPASPAQMFFGLRVSGGTATFSSRPDQASPTTLQLQAGSVLTLDLNIEQPGGPAFFKPPSSLTIEFTGDVVSALPPSTARISVGGAVIDVAARLPGRRMPDGVHLQFAGNATTVSDTASSGSATIELAGTWDVTGAEWRFACEALDLAALTLPGESGFGVFETDAGLTVSWRGANQPVGLDSATAVAHASDFEISAQTAARRARQTLREAERVLAEIRFDPASPILISRFESSASEMRLTTEATVRVTAPRPLTADGSPLPIEAASAIYALSELADGVTLLLTMRPAPTRTALALSNALFTVEGPEVAHLLCDLDADGFVTSARFACICALRGVIPFLHDPYVANFDPRPQQGREAHVVVTASWGGASDPAVRIDVRERDERGLILLNWMPQPLFDQLSFPGSHYQRTTVSSTVGRQSALHWLLDVSTNAGQFGIAIGNRQAVPDTLIADNTLHWNGLDTLIFSVPAIQWEPVADPKGQLLSVDDGGPTALAVDTVRLVPVAPVRAARALLAAYQGDDEPLRASFTLPFGIRASLLASRRAGLSARVHPRVVLDELTVDTLDKAPAIRMESDGVHGLPGNAFQTDNAFLAGTAQNTNVLGFSALDGAFPPPLAAPVVSAMFNGAFAEGPVIPLHRYDWSGFGASSFSHWTNEGANPPSVSQVRFDVINGRTSHEVVQVSAVLWPCQALLVRTITLERQNNAVVMRHDSGWVAVTDGRFTYPGTQCTFHPGVVHAYTKIREIRDTPRVVVAGGRQFQQVFFDANVTLDGLLSGGLDHAVPVQRHVGYVHFLPIGSTVTPAVLQELLQKEGAIGGPLDCEIEVNSSGPRVLVNSLLVDAAVRPPGQPEFVVSVNGMPKFPRSGEWTAVRTKGGQTTAVDSRIGVPVIREAALAHRFAEAADLFKPLAPDTEYGFLFSTSSHRVLFSRPEVKPAARVVTSPVPARMADPYAYAITNGLFPKAAAALAFPSPYVVDFADPIVFKQNAAKRASDLELVANKVMRLYVEAPATFDAAVQAFDWNTSSGQQTLFLDLLGFTKILAVRGEWAAESAGARKLKEPLLELSNQLDQVKEILDLLKKLKLPVDIDFSLRTEGVGTLALEASMAGHLAEPDGSRIDTGMGKLGGSVRLGVIIRASIAHGVQGCAFIEISGDLQQAIIPGLLFAGGHLRFRLGVFDTGETQLELTAGTVGSLGGDLIKGLIEVEGTVKYGYTMVVPGNNLDQIRLGVVLGMEVRAVLLSGLLGIKFGWEGGALMSLDPPKTHIIITAHVTASASVTAAWVFNSSRSITVEYTQEVPRNVALTVLAVTSFGVGPAAGAAALS